MISTHEWNQINEGIQGVIDKIAARFRANEKDIQTLVRRIEKLERNQ